MRVTSLIFRVCSIAKAGLVELHQTSFNGIRGLALPSSPAHMWLLKQADQAMLAIRSEFPEDSQDARMHSIVAIRNVVEHVLTRNPPFSDNQIQHIGSIIEARLKDFKWALNLGIGTLANELLTETGLDILSFEGMISPPELQASMGRVLRTLVTHLGREATEQVMYLYAADPLELMRYATALEMVTGQYEAVINRIGFDVQVAIPSWSSFIRVFESEISDFSQQIASLAAKVVRELQEHEADIGSWAVLLNHPRFIAQALPQGRDVYYDVRRFALMPLVDECYHGGSYSNAERICANLELLKVFFRHMIERDLSDLNENEKARLRLTFRTSWSGTLNRESIEMGIQRLEELPLRYPLELEDGPLTDFPVDSPVLIRIKTSLKILMHYEDNMEGLTDLRMSFVEAIRASINRLSPSQLVWLDNYIRDGLFRSAGRFLRGPVVESAAFLAYELARVCRIKLFDFIPENSIAGAESIRSIVSNLIVTEGGLIDELTFSVLRVATNPHLTPQQRELYADAWRTFTVAHKSFELRPLEDTRGPISLGRETAIAGFLLNSFREHPEQFLDVLTQYKMALYAPRRLKISRLPPFVDDKIAMLASPTERLTPLVIRIDSVYRQHAQRVGELLEAAGYGFDAGRLVRALKRFPAAIFRQLILRGVNMYQPIPEEYLAPAFKFAALLESFPDNFPANPLRGALMNALRSGEAIVKDIEKRPLEITRNTEALDTALTALA